MYHKAEMMDYDTDVDMVFAGEMMMVESEIMDIYKNRFNISATDKTYSIFSESQQIERYAQNLYFWHWMDTEYDKTDRARSFYIHLKKIEFTNTMNEYFSHKPLVLKSIYTRFVELVRCH